MVLQHLTIYSSRQSRSTPGPRAAACTADYPTERTPRGRVRTTENGDLFRTWHNFISVYHGLNTLFALRNCVRRLLVCFLNILVKFELKKKFSNILLVLVVYVIAKCICSLEMLIYNRQEELVKTCAPDSCVFSHLSLTINKLNHASYGN